MAAAQFRFPRILETKSAAPAAAPDRALDLSLTWEAKLASAEQRIIEGHAAVTGNLDLNGDVILPGAFASTVAAGAASIKVLVGHNYETLPVGRVVSVKEDARGLYAQARIFETSAGNDLLAVVKDAHDHGESIGMSIGYRVKDYAWKERDLGRGETRLVREIKDLEVREFSFVTFPANPKAVTTGVKHIEGKKGEHTIAFDIPEGATPEEAREILDRAFAALEAMDPTQDAPPPADEPVIVLASWQADAMLADLALRGALVGSKG